MSQTRAFVYLGSILAQFETFFSEKWAPCNTCINKLYSIIHILIVGILSCVCDGSNKRNVFNFITLSF